MSKPNESVIYKSYTGKLSTTMEARRSRLERMQTLPNIKLISPTASPRGTILDSTPEIPSEEDATPSTQQQQQQQQQRRPGKTISFVKRMSEGRFFQTDRSPCRRTTSPVLRRSPHLATSAPTVTRDDDAHQLQQLHVTLQPASVDVPAQQLNDADINDVDADRSVDVDENTEATIAQRPTDDEDRVYDGGLLQLQSSSEHSSSAETDDVAEITPLRTTTDC